MATQNQNPRISVNKLAQFATSKPARQRDILHDQKYPTDFKGMYHREATEAVTLCLAGNLEDLAKPETAMHILKQQVHDKIGTQRRVNANIGAIESFLEMVDQIALPDAALTLGESFPPKITIHGVEISVRPELILTGEGSKKQPLVGAMKVHFPTTYSLDEEAAGLVSAVTQEWCKIHKADAGTTYGPYCPVLDVGSKNYYPGVKSTIARMKDVAAACQNIADLWPAIKE